MVYCNTYSILLIYDGFQNNTNFFSLSVMPQVPSVSPPFHLFHSLSGIISTTLKQLAACNWKLILHEGNSTQYEHFLIGNLRATWKLQENNRGNVQPQFSMQQFCAVTVLWSKFPKRHTLKYVIYQPTVIGSQHDDIQIGGSESLPNMQS